MLAILELQLIGKLHWGHVAADLRDAAYLPNLGFAPEGLGARVHIASPSKQMGASISQMPIPSLLLPDGTNSCAVPAGFRGVDPNGAVGAGVGKAELGGMMLPENGSAVGTLFQFGLVKFGLPGFCGAVVKNPVGVAAEFVFWAEGKCTTPIAGKINAKQLVAQIKIKPVNFILFYSLQ
jgi:hypothetical protein